jgi:tetratricopeptide (TPR) repeat protein
VRSGEAILDLLWSVYSSNLGRFLYHARRYDEAIEVLQQTLARDPGRVYARVHLAMCYDQKGMYAEERRHLELITAAFKGQPGPGLAHFYARSGDSLKARRMAAQLKDAAKDSDWFFLAGVYAALGDKDEAFACLSKAYATHDFFLVFLKVHPYMDPLRADPRYTELLHRIGLDR